MTPEDSTSIPIVDLDDLRKQDASARGRAADALRVAFGHYGLAYLSNHGLSPADVDAWYDSFSAFTALPEASKRPLGRGDIWYQRGWTPPNTEKAVLAGGQPDFKECYFAAPVAVRDDLKRHYPQVYADNIWPPSAGAFDAEAFQRLYLAVGAGLHEIGMLLLRGCARALSLDEDVFDRAVAGGPHVTRMLRYLPLTAEQVNTGILWGEEHTDFNLLTLLPGGRFYDPSGKPCGRPDDKSGLYLRTRPTADAPRGALVRGAAPPGCIVAQVGQQLEILTGGTYLATPHVVTTPGVPGYTRMSSAHFIHLASDQVLFPFERFRTAESERAYSPPVLAGTYGIKTLVDIGLAPAAALDTLGYRHYDRLGAIRASEIGGSLVERRGDAGCAWRRVVRGASIAAPCQTSLARARQPSPPSLACSSRSAPCSWGRRAAAPAAPPPCRRSAPAARGAPQRVRRGRGERRRPGRRPAAAGRLARAAAARRARRRWPGEPAASRRTCCAATAPAITRRPRSVTPAPRTAGRARSAATGYALS
jgi:isopenicillin N synthase-like dioxygenase